MCDSGRGRCFKIQNKAKSCVAHIVWPGFNLDFNSFGVIQNVMNNPLNTDIVGKGFFRNACNIVPYIPMILGNAGL